MKRDIILKWFHPYPAEEVWECLTNAELISQWLMKTDFKPVPGHKFRFVTTPKPAFKWNGIVYCEVTELVPFKKLSFTWRSGPEEGVVTMDTVVTWILEPKDNGTELTLEHKGFGGMKNVLVSFMMEKGWKKHIAKRFADILKNDVHAKV